MNRDEQMDGAAVLFEEVSLGYSRAGILNDLSFSIAEGDFLGVIGPNGSGKTTLLRAILRIVKPLRGSIRIREGLKFGYVMQRQSLDEIFPLSVLDIVSMGRLGRARSAAPLRRGRFAKRSTKPFRSLGSRIFAVNDTGTCRADRNNGFSLHGRSLSTRTCCFSTNPRTTSTSRVRNRSSI